MAISFLAGLYGFLSRLRVTKRNSKRVTRDAMFRIPFRFQIADYQLFEHILIFWQSPICDKRAVNAHI